MSKTRSEDVLGEKWDRCLADTTVKMLGGQNSYIDKTNQTLVHILGLTVGSVFSLALFKRRMWPVTFGLGAGFGMGYANCEHELNEPYMVHIKDLKKLEEQIDLKTLDQCVEMFIVEIFLMIHSFAFQHLRHISDKEEC